ncbi:uncharacterized protein LOC126769229 [Nymphalis io]|uniref:uncharacterized protein LOC126769229 n=1 Tax=Inachis io TaxID=171585 RepID=UPI002168242E|nr:uncharacterized protein LOC126769229 [Nymphalis io]
MVLASVPLGYVSVHQTNTDTLTLPDAYHPPIYIVAVRKLEANNSISSSEQDIRFDPSTFWGYEASKRNKGKKRRPILNNGKSIPDSEWSLSLADVELALEKLKPKRSTGPDGIPPYIIKDCRSVFASPLLYIKDVNLCCTSLICVSQPVGTQMCGKSHVWFWYLRIISEQTVFGKLFESILHRLISVQVEIQLSDAQHGFRVGRSTTSNLLSFYSYAAMGVDRGFQVDTAYFDFRKAFDTVDNDLLLRKFAAAGFTPALLQIFSCYLRRQYVQFNGQWFSGISKGSNLGSLEFLIFINDLPDAVSAAHSLLFADNLKLFLKIKMPSNCYMLQKDVQNVEEWSKRNRLMFNDEKCSIISFTRANIPFKYDYRLTDVVLGRLSTIKDLGVLLSDKLSFTDHVYNITKTAYKYLGFVLRQSKNLESVAAVKILYNCFVRSTLESNSVIWSLHKGYHFQSLSLRANIVERSCQIHSRSSTQAICGAWLSIGTGERDTFDTRVDFAQWCPGLEFKPRLV